jgi:hypothetical protein
MQNEGAHKSRRNPALCASTNLNVDTDSYPSIFLPPCNYRTKISAHLRHLIPFCNQWLETKVEGGPEMF